MNDRSPRPLEVIEADVSVTRRALQVTARMVDNALDERMTLLELGWPASHPLCKELDDVAAAWAVRREQFLRQLQELANEVPA